MRAMQISSDHPLLLRIVDDLAERGWSQQNIFLPLGLTRELAAECRKRAAEGELAPAAVGRGPTSEIREGIRGDHIQWIEPGQALACDSYLSLMDSLREAMNRGLYLASKISKAISPCTRPVRFTSSMSIVFGMTTGAWFRR